MEIKGKIIARMDVRSGTSAKSGKSWKSVDYVVEFGSGQYPQHAVISFGPEVEKTDEALSKLRKDTEGTFQIDIDAREYNGKWYNSLKCWKFEIEAVQAPTQPSAVPQPAQPAPAVQAPTAEVPTTSGGDDLPF